MLRESEGRLFGWGEHVGSFAVSVSLNDYFFFGGGEYFTHYQENDPVRHPEKTWLGTIPLTKQTRRSLLRVAASHEFFWLKKSGDPAAREAFASDDDDSPGEFRMDRWAVEAYWLGTSRGWAELSRCLCMFLQAL